MVKAVDKLVVCWQKISCAGLGLLFLCTSVAWVGELILDGGLESGTTTHWHKWGLKEWSVVESPVMTGSYSGRICDSETGYGYIEQRGICVSPEKIYTASVWVYDNDPDGNVTIRIYWYSSLDGSGSSIGKAESTSSSDIPSFQKLTTGEVKPPAGANSCNVRVWVSDTGTHGERIFFVDNISFQERVPVPQSPAYEEKPTDKRIEIQNSPFFPYQDMYGKPSKVKIKYNVPNSSRITIRIFDVRGKLIRVLLDAEMDYDGTGWVTWDGRYSAEGDIVPVGVYICQIEAIDENRGKVLQGLDKIIIGRRLK